MNKGIIIWICFVSLLLPGLSCAHPDSGFLPDAIAETEYRIVIDLNPKDIGTRNKLGIVLYRKNKLEEALMQFREVLTLSPDNFDAHDGIGLVLTRQGRLEDAIGWFEKAVGLNKTDAMVYYHLGTVNKLQGNTGKAIELYKKALSLKEEPSILKDLKELGEIEKKPGIRSRMSAGGGK